jgi:hypothetical protein
MEICVESHLFGMLCARSEVMRITTFACAAGAICFAMAQVTYGQVTYTYTGKDFTVFEPAYVGVPLTSSDSISGSFTVPSVLSPGGHTFYAITPGFSYDFSDGVNTYDNSNQSIAAGGFGNQFYVFVGATGAITDWQIDSEISPVVDGSQDYKEASLQTAWEPNFIPGHTSDAVIFEEYSYYNDGALAPGPGSWSGPIEAGSPVPEQGQTFAMMIGSLGLLGWVGRYWRPRIRS